MGEVRVTTVHRTATLTAGAAVDGGVTVYGNRAGRIALRGRVGADVELAGGGRAGGGDDGEGSAGNEAVGHLMLRY